MNSLSNGNCYDNNYNPCAVNPCKVEQKEEKSCQPIIKCSCPTSTVVPLVSIGDSFTVASLNLNTSKISNPCVKLEFATNLIGTVAGAGILRFQVFKQCTGQMNPVPIGPTWSYGPIAIGNDTFSFFVCDCDDSCFDGCCTYTVVATTTVALGTLSLNNSTLGAIVTCGCSCN
ncbi:MAG: DUF4489 domain-containing protein [Clostridium sp.]|jgi:hypothetical protein|uniref:DUF4489 domain-containing protein n=1 Tax=Clostridium sp. TaxID=1506 RepID=UPI0025C200D5|nr:DUF4489 domain-containing protein [Clostridium sp.]MCH3962843.1 DUF4489 domain-containing protein [Clostridium sp.]MCI1715742.1 DUF4489 domain-containing protein [Clostridium sp.]MCI1800053.1 DUF4489 domain-containing protein [Clostridium sp.]MCI1813967.1 DUF4489 domain-containing protein [Clostridium sp.]MCI1870865.1 DUF4489 domain-containing protein [Clostridium sp.]